MELPREINWGDLKNRTQSAAILAVIALVCAWLGGIFFASFIILAALLMFKEWEKLVSTLDRNFEFGGYPYIILPCASIIWLRDNQGFIALLALIAVISATDIAAYFTGKKFGKHIMFPSLSPKKTWEGLAGGVIAAMITGAFFASYISPKYLAFGIVVGSLLAVVAQAGDFFESWVKRKADVKDSGEILPGHGGLLDRFDGYMFAAPLFVVIVYIFT